MRKWPGVRTFPLTFDRSGDFWLRAAPFYTPPSQPQQCGVGAAWLQAEDSAGLHKTPLESGQSHLGCVGHVGDWIGYVGNSQRPSVLDVAITAPLLADAFLLGDFRFQVRHSSQKIDVVDWLNPVRLDLLVCEDGWDESQGAFRLQARPVDLHTLSFTQRHSTSHLLSGRQQMGRKRETKYLPKCQNQRQHWA